MGQRNGHVIFYGGRNGGLLVGCTDPEIRRAQVLELAGPDLGDFNARDERQNHVCWETLFEIGLDTNGVCGVHEDAGMLRSDDRLDDGCKVVHVGQGLDA